MTIAEINVREWGSGSKTALLIHGLAGSSLTWRKFARDLAAEGYRVVAPDLRGHGQSVRSEQYSVQEWSQDILNMNLNPELIIGHSIGGLIAANVQQTLKADKLVLIDPVFHLPKNELLLKRIQDGFTTVTLAKYFFAHQRANKIKDKDYLRTEVVGIHQWDTNSVKALRPFKNLIVKCLLGKGNVLLMRAKGSYILPPSVMKRKFNDNIKLLYVGDSGHNIHATNYDIFWKSINNFIKEPKERLIYGGNTIPFQTAMQNLPQSA